MHRHVLCAFSFALCLSAGSQNTQTADPLAQAVERGDSGTWRGGVQSFLDSICSSEMFETTQLGLYIYDLTDGNVLYSRNGGKRMRPASCQKLVTAISALSVLGGGYQFVTSVHLDGKAAGGTLSGNVYITGGMDPLLSSADIYGMARAIKEAGIDSIAGHVCADLSMKDDKPYGWGWCWDDDEGPLSALMADGKDRFADVWLRAAKSCGIALADTSVVPAQTPSSAAPLLSFSHTIDEVLLPMMKDSNNTFAECVFYNIAAAGGRKHAGRKQAAKAISGVIASAGLRSDVCQIADGSGLSLYNYVTPQVLVGLLNRAYIDEGIRQHLLAALPVGGVDGTLEKRMLKTKAAGNVRAKTGTVEGVSSLSGYLITSHGHLLSFSIINQGVMKSETGKNFQDKVCIRLCE